MSGLIRFCKTVTPVIQSDRFQNYEKLNEKINQMVKIDLKIENEIIYFLVHNVKNETSLKIYPDHDHE